MYKVSYRNLTIFKVKIGWQSLSCRNQIGWLWPRRFSNNGAVDWCTFCVHNANILWLRSYYSACVSILHIMVPFLVAYNKVVGKELLTYCFYHEIQTIMSCDSDTMTRNLWCSTRKHAAGLCLYGSNVKRILHKYLNFHLYKWTFTW